MKKINQKLVLNKQTIANLNLDEMRNSLAGRLAGVKAELTIIDRSCPIHCPTTTNKNAQFRADTFLFLCQMTVPAFCQ